MFAKTLISVLGTAVLAACAVSRSRNAEPVMKPAAGPPAPSRVDDRPSSLISLQIVGRASGAMFKLENDSDHPIFVSYVPPGEGTVTKFLTYSLQGRKLQSDDFKLYGEEFHTVPNLHPILPRSALTFRLIHYPFD